MGVTGPVPPSTLAAPGGRHATSQRLRANHIRVHFGEEIVVSRSDFAKAWLPENYGPLIVQPVQAMSVAMQTTTVIPVGRHEVLRVPIVTKDPQAQWVNEGAEITPDHLAGKEVVAIPAKVAGLTVITRELVEDSAQAVAEIVGQGLARDIARQVDQAFFGSLPPPAPPGLESLTDVQGVDAGPAWANVDPFVEAVSKLEDVGATASVFVANPADALALAKIKEANNSNRPLLQPDPTQPTRRMLHGVPLLTSPYVTEGIVWAWDSSRVMTALREDTRVDVDKSAYFTSDRLAVRATMRVAFAFPHEAAIVAVRLTPSGD